MNIDLNKLTSFLYLANQKGYGTGDYSSWVKEKDGSTSIVFQDQNWRMHDNFFGGEPFGGRTVVFVDEKPIWLMTYYGKILPENTLKIEEIYGFLQKALLQTIENFPVRGPQKYTHGKFEYLNSWQGKIDDFSGQEMIFHLGKKIYQASYLGGLVNLRFG